MPDYFNISKVELEGFQVFGKPTSIPLSRLTLIYGPNSAGKSAIQDALELYRTLMSVSIYFPDDKALVELLKRHWRRQTSAADSLVDLLRIAVSHKVSIPRFVEARTSTVEVIKHGGMELVPEGYFSVIVNSEFELAFLPGTAKPDFDCIARYRLSIGDDLILEVDDRGIGIAIDSPYFDKKIPQTLLRKFARQVGSSDVSLDGNWLHIQGDCGGFRANGLGYADQKGNWLQYGRVDAATRIWNSNETKEQRKAATELAELVGAVAISAGSFLTRLNLLLEFVPNKVDASRKVPTRDDMTFVLGNLNDSMQPAKGSEIGMYKRLAESAVPEVIKNQESIHKPEKLREYFHGVNTALTDDLFFEQGYRIDYDYRVLLNKANSRAALNVEPLDSRQFGFIVELFLRDGVGRKHAFEDVGSGIGYVLPVLCMAFEHLGPRGSLFDEPSVSTGFIQQPELHLHPAMQAALGDVFIKASAGGNQLLIETHSEHLLLRLLKRIRQSAKGETLQNELYFDASDLCVLYFLPTPEGETTVKRLRVSKRGEFMDRWPRGFFAERDGELFDE